jgi:hypothetical protein
MLHLDSDEKAKGIISVEIAAGAKLEITLALSDYISSDEFEAVLRGVSETKSRCRVVGASCYWEVEKNGRRRISTEIAPP